MRAADVAVYGVGGVLGCLIVVGVAVAVFVATAERRSEAGFGG